METIESIGFGNFQIVQDSQSFRFGIDAILISDFAASLSPNAKTIADLGTGNGIIATVICHKNANCHVTGIDVQQESIDLANKGKVMNGLQDRLEFIAMDISEIAEGHRELHRQFDAVVTNPPYVEAGSGIASSADAKYIARHETTADLKCFIQTASLMLRPRGDFFIVQRPSRLPDIMYLCRENGLEPKHMRLVSPYQGEEPNIVLLHAVQGAGKELKVMKELVVRSRDGRYTDEINAIYER
ncbi:MAG: methyltransferase [Bacillota bacterium]|nr:methyltransferase [Bacillota bacterium]